MEGNLSLFNSMGIRYSNVILNGNSTTLNEEKSKL